MEDDFPVCESLDDLLGFDDEEIPNDSGGKTVTGTTYIVYNKNNYEEEVEEELTNSSEIQHSDLYLINTLLENELLTPAFQAVFEQRSHSEQQLCEKLQETIEIKRSQIKTLCASNHQEFLSSVEELISLKVDLKDLKDNVEKFDENLQVHGKELLDKRIELTTLLRTFNNIRNARSQIVNCLSLLHRAKQIQLTLQTSQISALRQISELKSKEDDLIGHSFEWSKYYFEKVITDQQLFIKNSALQKFNDWLVTVRDSSPSIGQFAIAQSASHKLNSLGRGDGERIYKKLSSIEPLADRLTYYLYNYPDLLKSNKIEEINIFDYIKIDFTGVYQCIRIHDLLNLQSNFQKYYLDNRKLQCDLVLKVNELFEENNNINKKSASRNDSKFFHHVAGFFIIEHAIYHHSSDFVPRSEMDYMWNLAITRITQLMDELIIHQNKDELICLIDNLFCFTWAMRNYSFDVSHLFELLSQLCEQFITISLRFSRSSFLSIIEEDNYQPMEINRNDLDQYRKLITENQLDLSEDNKERKDITIKGNLIEFPFTIAIPLLYIEIKKFLITSENLSQLCIKPDVSICDSSIQVIKQMINCFSLSLDESFNHQNLFQLIQIFQNFCEVVKTEGNVKNILIGLNISAILIKKSLGQLKVSYKSTLCHIEEKLADLFKMKISGYFHSVLSLNISWTGSREGVRASEFVSELSMYLPALYENILMIKNDENQQKYFFIVNKFIAEEMKNLLIEVNEFNYFAIKQLELDVNQLIVFAEQNSPLKISSLSLSFAPILQVIYMLTNNPKYDEKLADKSGYVKIISKYNPSKNIARVPISLDFLDRLKSGKF